MGIRAFFLKHGADITAFCRRHVEAVAIIPAILLACAIGWYLTWRRGLPLIELGPIIADYAVGLLAVAGIGYLAWRFKSEYWHDLSDADEIRLRGQVEGGNRQAFWLLILDRLEYLALLIVLLLGFARYAGASDAVDLITKWEVSGPAGYATCCARPIRPPGASGITFGVGYDGGHQHAETILREWAASPYADRLATTAGLTGQQAQAALPAYRDIIIEWSQAVAVLEHHSIPRYRAMARRAYGRAYSAAPQPVQDALLSETYNRGQGMAGDARRERRHIRDWCLPQADWLCVATALETSCRVWAGKPYGPGLCNRRYDEARVVRALF